MGYIIRESQDGIRKNGDGLQGPSIKRLSAGPRHEKALNRTCVCLSNLVSLPKTQSTVKGLLYRYFINNIVHYMSHPNHFPTILVKYLTYSGIVYKH